METADKELYYVAYPPTGHRGNLGSILVQKCFAIARAVNVMRLPLDPNIKPTNSSA